MISSKSSAKSTRCGRNRGGGRSPNCFPNSVITASGARLTKKESFLRRPNGPGVPSPLFLADPTGRLRPCSGTQGRKLKVQAN